MTLQQTLVLIKPDGLAKGLTCHDLIPTSDLNIIKVRKVRPTLELAQTHYEEHRHNHWFNDITNGLASDEVLAVVIESDDAIRKMRNVIGNRNDPNTLRGKYSNPDVKHENAVHGSDSIESAEREILLWFPEFIC